MPFWTSDRSAHVLPQACGRRSVCRNEARFRSLPHQGLGSRGSSGFSLVELIVVVLVAAIITVIAMPQVVEALKGYRLHNDASAISAQLNVTRFRATAQFTPFRMNITTGTSPQIFSTERLCGTDLDCQPPASPCAQSYMPYLQPDIQSGSQYLSSGISFTTINPGGTVLPPSLSGTGTGSAVFYFNTRGLPADCTGTPLNNGGAVIYLKNGNNLSDAVVVTEGGGISIFEWSLHGNTWVAR